MISTCEKKNNFFNIAARALSRRGRGFFCGAMLPKASNTDPFSDPKSQLSVIYFRPSQFYGKSGKILYSISDQIYSTIFIMGNNPGNYYIYTKHEIFSKAKVLS